MLQRALIIARKDLYLRFTNRNQLLLMVAVPLALSSIIALVFGNLGGPDDNLVMRDIPLGIVNLDAGTQQQGREVNYGEGLVQLLTRSEPVGLTDACPLAAAVPASAGSALDELFDARALDDVAAGRALVERWRTRSAHHCPGGLQRPPESAHRPRYCNRSIPNLRRPLRSTAMSRARCRAWSRAAWRRATANAC